MREEELREEERVAEQMAIRTCSTLIRWLLRDDPSVCRALEEILEEEEERVNGAAPSTMMP